MSKQHNGSLAIQDENRALRARLAETEQTL